VEVAYWKSLIRKARKIVADREAREREQYE
jgi:hypothetical protein